MHLGIDNDEIFIMIILSGESIAAILEHGHSFSCFSAVDFLQKNSSKVQLGSQEEYLPVPPS